MLNVGGGELLLILLVALIVLGPDKLPDAARQAGKVMREFRRISSGFQREMREAMKDPVTAATQERKLDNRVSFEPPPPFASQKADPEPDPEPDPDSEAIDEADPDTNDPAEVSEATDAAAGEALDEEDAAAAGSARAGADDEDADDEGADSPGTPDDPEVGIPSDR